MQYYLNDKKLNKIEKQKAEKDGLKIFEELGDYALKGWEEMDEVDLQMRLKWYGLFWRPKTPGRFMMRHKIAPFFLSCYTNTKGWFNLFCFNKICGIN